MVALLWIISSSFRTVGLNYRNFLPETIFPSPRRSDQHPCHHICMAVCVCVCVRVCVHALCVYICVMGLLFMMKTYPSSWVARFWSIRLWREEEPVSGELVTQWQVSHSLGDSKLSYLISWRPCWSWGSPRLLLCAVSPLPLVPFYHTDSHHRWPVYDPLLSTYQFWKQ